MKYNDGGFYTSDLLSEQEIHHGFGTKRLDLAVIANPDLSKGKQSPVYPANMPKTKQVHGTDVVYLDSIDNDKLYIGDAWYTDKKEIICYVKTADCLPLLLYDSKNKIVGAVHCGWRGIAGHIVQKTIDEFKEKNAEPENIIAVIGPHIMTNCYQVSEELINIFRDNGWATEKLIIGKSDAFYFSLESAIKSELEESGLDIKKIDSSDSCTFCRSENFYSYRRDPSEKGRQVSFISL